MREKVLITGASGFLGFHLLEAAIGKGLDVYAAVRKSSDIAHLKNMPLQFVELNYSKVDEMAALFAREQFDYIIHAAGTTKALTQEDYNRVNDSFTVNLAAAAAQNKDMVKRFVFISSLAAVGPTGNINAKIRETDAPVPVTAYGKSKLSAEVNLNNIELPVTILRPTAIYGPRERDIFIVTQYLNKGFDPYIGKFSQKLSFVYAKDMANVSVNALTKTDANGVFHISDGNEYSRYAYADIVKELLGKKALRFHLPMPVVKGILFAVEGIHKAMKKVPAVSIEKLNELAAVNWDCDISKARSILGFNPAYDLGKGLEETVKWYKDNKWI